MRATLGDQEHEILQAVWRLGPCSVRQVHESVGEPRGLAYTTTATVLERLSKKGFIKRERAGKALVYQAVKRQSAVQGNRVRSLVERIFGTDPEPAVARLVDAVETYDPAMLDRLAEEIALRKKARRGS